jgi:CheY-like chemotaxis protein
MGALKRERGLQSARVLVVEDAQDIREAFELLLQAEGAEVVATASGREASEAIARQDFDVVLTDIGLPDMPGDEVIQNVLATARRRPWIVVLTGYDEPYVSRARKAGADVVLTKPLPWSALLSWLTPQSRAAA